MSVNIELPNINTTTAEGQQIRNYLFKLAEQLNWALNTVNEAERGNTGNVKVINSQGGSSSGELSPNEAAETFASIKSLIIKSADIVNAYQDVMEQRFEGIYVANSEYGNYKKETNNVITTNSNSITQLLTSKDKIENTVKKLSDTIKKTEGYIITGSIGETDEDGNELYGIRIGQTIEIDGINTFKKMATFTADKLTFYNAYDEPIAYISGQSLYITEVRITGNAYIGKFLMDSSDGLAFKWVG